MTSKEAIQKIDLTIKYGSMTQDEINSYLQYKKLIEKDLDVLEIIKGKLMWVENDKIYIGLQNDTYIELTEEDFNYDDRYRILKEWLKNDK